MATARVCTLGNRLKLGDAARSLGFRGLCSPELQERCSPELPVQARAARNYLEVPDEELLHHSESAFAVPHIVKVVRGVAACRDGDPHTRATGAQQPLRSTCGMVEGGCSAYAAVHDTLACSATSCARLSDLGPRPPPIACPLPGCTHTSRTHEAPSVHATNLHGVLCPHCLPLRCHEMDLRTLPTSLTCEGTACDCDDAANMDEATSHCHCQFPAGGWRRRRVPEASSSTSLPPGWSSRYLVTSYT